MPKDNAFRRTVHAKISGWLMDGAKFNLDIGLGKAPNIISNFKWNDKQNRFESFDGKTTYTTKDVYGVQKIGEVS